MSTECTERAHETPDLSGMSEPDATDLNEATGQTPTMKVTQPYDLMQNAAFVKFVEENHIDPLVYQLAGSLPRYIRVNPQHNPPVTLDMLKSAFDGSIEPVSWLPGFYSLDADEQLVNKDIYTSGGVYGIDVSSGVAVAAMDIQPGDHCLDLCCAPGGKLCMIADEVGSEGSATGVDLSAHRLYTCRSIVKKYHHGNVRLYLNDGTKFETRPPLIKTDEHKCDKCTPTGPRKKKRRRRGQQPPEGLLYEPKIWTKTFCAESDSLYDRVLVDAECTHDGSLKHLAKCKDIGWDRFVEEFIGDEAKVNRIVTMQKRLLAHGVAMTRPGGHIVYSTCSLTRAQNEDVVMHALQTIDHIMLVPIDLPNLPVKAGSRVYSLSAAEVAHEQSEIDSSRGGRHKPSAQVEETLLPHVLRFDPLVTHTSGLFIAKFRRIK